MDGAANAAVIELLAEVLGVARRTIQIVQGETGRNKVVEVAGTTADEIRRRLDGGKSVP